MESKDNTIVDRLITDYPYLEERALVHFINDFGERRDHQDQQKHISNSGLLTRIIDKVSGKSGLRQQAIDESTEDSLKFIKDYIIANEERWANNSEFLTEVAEGVGLLSGKLQQVDKTVEDIKQLLAEVKGRVDDIEIRLDYQQSYTAAQTEMNHALSVFSREDDALAPEHKLWLLLNRLKYGHFGQWLMNGNQAGHRQQVITILDTLKNECLRILNQHTGRQSAELFDRSRLFSSLTSKVQDISEALCLVTNDRDNDENDTGSGVLESLVYSLNNGDELPESGDLPFIFSNSSVYENMVQTLKKDIAYDVTN